VLLSVEAIALFVAIPLLFYFRVFPNYPIPFLVLVAAGAYVQLRSDSTFDLRRLWNWPAALRHLRPMLARTAALCAVIGLAVGAFAPGLLLSFPRTNFRLWMAVMVFYPLVSVYPQELLFRAFFLQRYRRLFGSGWGMVAVSAAVFGFVHIIFGNWLSVGMTAVGGVLFAISYRSSGSLALAVIEHALFGNFLFTIGLGQFFYHGARR
jgi:membrane protease YdiL (CAAX protease family)